MTRGVWLMRQKPATKHKTWTAALAVLTRLGFMETGRAERTLLVGDTWCDSIYLGLSRPQP